MSDMRSRYGVLLSLAAAVGAFGAASLMSAATAPTARADDFTNVISVVDGDYADAQTNFTAALADFSSSSEFAPGLAALFDGVDNSGLNAPNDLLAGTVEVLTNESVDRSDPYNFLLPTDFTQALAFAQEDFSDGQDYFTGALNYLSLGDYGDALNFDLNAADSFTILPLQELLLGAAASF